jgi:hypothetical protein
MVRASVSVEEAETPVRPGVATVPRSPPSALSGQPGTTAYGAPCCGEAEPLGPSISEAWRTSRGLCFYLFIAVFHRSSEAQATCLWFCCRMGASTWRSSPRAPRR